MPRAPQYAYRSVSVTQTQQGAVTCRYTYLDRASRRMVTEVIAEVIGDLELLQESADLLVLAAHMNRERVAAMHLPE